MRRELFGEDYFERGVELGLSGYERYRWLPELTIPLAHEIVTQLGIDKRERVLDFGCAKGYLVRALRLLHYDAFGLDVSAYAIAEAPEDVRTYLFRCDEQGLVVADGSGSAERFIKYRFSREGRDADWAICKDVLEHLSLQELQTVLDRLRQAAEHIFVVVPLGEDGRYVVPEYERDVTHVIREGLDWWCAAVEQAGFKVKSAAYRMPHVKENWAGYERGNGFIVAS